MLFDKSSIHYYYDFLGDEFIGNFVQAELYAITGNRVGVFTDLRQIDVSGLTNGMYFLKLTDKDNNQYSTRVLKNSR